MVFKKIPPQRRKQEIFISDEDFRITPVFRSLNIFITKTRCLFSSFFKDSIKYITYLLYSFIHVMVTIQK